jgi:hypothetical protein
MDRQHQVAAPRDLTDHLQGRPCLHLAFTVRGSNTKISPPSLRRLLGEDHVCVRLAECFSAVPAAQICVLQTPPTRESSRGVPGTVHTLVEGWGRVWDSAIKVRSAVVGKLAWILVAKQYVGWRLTALRTWATRKGISKAQAELALQTLPTTNPATINRKW